MHYLQKCHYEMNEVVQQSWNVNLPIRMLNSVNHEAFEPINISCVPTGQKREHRLMTIASAYGATEKKSFIVQVKVYI